jgi:hypothetical protein
MGQARVKRDALRQMLLRKAGEWDFPSSPWEAAACAELELREEDVIFVPREPADRLDARMRGVLKSLDENGDVFQESVIDVWKVRDPSKID